jgi:hypothetical protein
MILILFTIFFFPYVPTYGAGFHYHKDNRTKIFYSSQYFAPVLHNIASSGVHIDMTRWIEFGFDLEPKFVGDILHMELQNTLIL